MEYRTSAFMESYVYCRTDFVSVRNFFTFCIYKTAINGASSPTAPPGATPNSVRPGASRPPIGHGVLRMYP